MAYSEKVIDHYQNPKNVGTLDKAKKSVGTGLVGAPECGDVMRLAGSFGESGLGQVAVVPSSGLASMLFLLATRRFRPLQTTARAPTQ